MANSQYAEDADDDDEEMLMIGKRNPVGVIQHNVDCDHGNHGAGASKVHSSDNIVPSIFSLYHVEPYFLLIMGRECFDSKAATAATVGNDVACCRASAV